MDAELYSRVRKLEKQVEALLERHPEVRTVLEREREMALNSPPINTTLTVSISAADSATPEQIGSWMRRHGYV